MHIPGNSGGRSILHFITDLSVGGAQTALLRLLSAQVGSAWQPAVVSLKDGGALVERFRSLGVDVVELGINSWLSAPSAVARAHRRLRGVKPAVAQAWMYHANLAATGWAATRARGAPVFWHIPHCVYDIAREKRATAAAIRLGARLSPRAARIIYNSTVAASQHERLGYAADKTVIIPDGFDLDVTVRRAEARDELRQQLALPPEALLIGLVARYHPLKDHDNFINAAQRIAAAVPLAHFVLAGSGVEWSNAKLAARIRDAGLEQRVSLLGHVADVPRLMSGLDLLCSSSLSEAFPNVLGEALACEVPCVATDVGDSARLVGQAGVLVPPRDPAALAAAVRRLCEASPAERRELGRVGRAHIARNFSLPTVNSQFTELYSRVLRGEPAYA